MGDCGKVGDCGKMPGDTLCWAQLLPQWSCCRTQQGLSVMFVMPLQTNLRKSKSKCDSWTEDKPVRSSPGGTKATEGGAGGAQMAEQRFPCSH